MEKMTQIYYRVPLKQKKIMDTYTKLHHITNNEFLRKVFSDKMLEVKADLMSMKFGEKLAKELVNKEIHNEMILRSGFVRSDLISLKCPSTKWVHYDIKL